MLNKRTQILFDKELWQTLVDLAKAKKTSVGELVRVAVRKEYRYKTAHLRKIVQDIRRFRDTRGANLGKGEDSTSIIRKMRDERYGQKYLRRLSNY